jgi:hypothetical protein
MKAFFGEGHDKLSYHAILDTISHGDCFVVANLADGSPSNLYTLAHVEADTYRLTPFGRQTWFTVDVGGRRCDCSGTCQHVEAVEQLLADLEQRREDEIEAAEVEAWINERRQEMLL